MIREHSHSNPIIKAASACVWRGNEVLLVQRASALGRGLWSFPGGKLEAGETTQDTAQRELFEETGVMANLSHHIADYTVELAELTYIISCYTGQYLRGEAVAASDAGAVVWVDWQSLTQFSLSPHIAAAVALARKLTSV